jgi:hypothetical protein
MTIFSHAQAWLEYGAQYAVHKSLWDSSCVLATLGHQPDRGDKARDFSGRRNHGTLTGATHLPTWSNHSYRGQSFRGLTFDGTEDYVNCGAAIASALDGVTCSFSLWFYATAGNDYHRIVSCLTGSTYAGIEIYFGGSAQFTDNRVVLQIAKDGTTNLSRTDTQYSLNAWHHVYAQQSGSSRRIWVDGVEPAYVLQTTTHSSFDSGTNFYIANWPGGAGYNFPGSIASVFVWARLREQSEIQILALHPLAAYEVWLPEYFFGASTAVTLTVAASAVDVTSDSPTLTQHNTLAVGNAVCSVTSGNVALVQHSALTVQSSQLATASQSPVLLQHNAVAVGNAVCSVMAGNVLLTQHHALSVDGSAVATTSEAVSLTQHNALEVGNSSCAVATESLALTQHGSLSVNGSAIGVTAQQVALTQHSALTLGNSICAVTSDNVALTQHGALTVQAAACVVSSENLTLTAHAPAHVSLTVAGSKCSVTSGAVSLTQHNVMAVAASAVVVTAGNVTLAYHAAGAALILEHQTLLLAI